MIPLPLSYVAVAGMCAECMRANVDGDRNFCENKIRNRKCELLKV